ncbi:MAG: CHASE2 domain-containing protein, partial [Verrucomicrobiales bacterium]
MRTFKPKARSWLIPALIPPLVLGLLLLLKSTPFGKQLENLSENWRFQFRGRSDPPPDQRILVAGIGDYSLAAVGRWEDWTRDIHAVVSHKLTLKAPKALVYDFFFSETSRDPAHDLAFADALSLHPGAVTGAIANPDTVQRESY